MTIVKFRNVSMYHIRCDKSILTTEDVAAFRLTLAELLEEDGVIIWENQGAFRLIFSSVIRNCEICYEVAEKIGVLYPRAKAAGALRRITWEQGVPISKVIIENLLHEETDDLGDTDSTADTTSEDDPV